MTGSYLLLDFGASRVKAALFDQINMRLYGVHSFSPPGNCSTKGSGYFEISCKEIRHQFQEICSWYWQRERFQGVFLCAQMHGFALLDANGKFVSEYISWQDQRSLDEIEGRSSYQLLKEQLSSSAFKQRTGLKLRHSYPVANLIHLLRADPGLPASEVIDLCGVITAGERFGHRIHRTMLSGMGGMDLNTGSMDEIDQIIQVITGKRLRWGMPSFETEIAGYWTCDRKEIPVYVGVGDHQCSVLGAGNRLDHTISINMGTGSQVSIVRKGMSDTLHNNDFDLRPFFEGEYLQCVTHIPSGRVLNCFLALIESVNKAGKGKLDIWDELLRLNEQDIPSGLPSFHLGLFEGAWGYDGAMGKISGIHEGQWNLQTYLLGMISSYIEQYQRVIETLDPNEELSQCILSGGLPRRIPIISMWLTKILKRSVILSRFEEETLVGLATLSLKKDCADKSLDSLICSIHENMRIHDNLAEEVKI